MCIEPDHDRRLELENNFIIRLKTAYPYGLNDRVNNISVSSVKDKLCIYQSFFQNNSTSIPKTNRVRSANRINRYIDFDEFLNEVCTDSFKKSNFIKYIKGKILGLSRQKAKVLINVLKNFKFTYSHIKDLIIDLVKFKTNLLNINENPSSFDSYLIIEFSHKYVDLLNIPQILQDKELIEAFPRKDTYPKISFRYCRTLGSITFNHTKISKGLLTDDIAQYP